MMFWQDLLNLPFFSKSPSTETENCFLTLTGSCPGTLQELHK